MIDFYSHLFGPSGDWERLFFLGKVLFTLCITHLLLQQGGLHS